MNTQQYRALTPSGAWLLRWMFALMLALVAAQALAQTSVRNFDHVKTGFPLTGVHVTQRCESCHINGVFKGTPKDCTSCHTSGQRLAGSNIVKPAQHIPTQLSCDSCHNTQSFTGARFNHTGVAKGTCSTCHNGAFPPADGRPVNHTPYERIAGLSIANCDTCHKAGFNAWAPARLHSSVTVSNQCATCHSGSKPNTPIHAGVTNCETCHRTTGWAGARVNHSTFTAATNCASCHNGATATGKPVMHIPVAAVNCISCHTTTTWRPSRFNHTQVAVTNQCSTCHSGAFPPAGGRPVTHIPYQTLVGLAIINCDTCHRGSFASWAPARFHANVSVSTQCAACHSGLYAPARGKPNTPAHIGVTTCESCHRSTASWLTVVFAHPPFAAVGTGTCDNCHNGATAKGKSATHIPVTPGVAKCDSCHRSQTSFATAVTMNHSVVVTTSTCKSCHNGSYITQGTTGALAKPVNHIPEAQLLNGAAMDCKACHTGTTSWVSMRMSHNGSLGGGAGSCKSCHATGTNYLGNMQKNALTHRTKTLPAMDCSESGCHRPLGIQGTSYTSWF